MKQKQRQLETSFDITLRASEGDVALEARSVLLFLAGEALVEARLSLSTDVATLRRIEEHGEMHLTEDVRLPSGAEPFDPAAPVLIEARLDPKLLSHLPADPADAADVLKSPVGDARALLDTSAWYVLHVSQSRGPVNSGYATMWFAPGERRPRAAREQAAPK